MTLKEFSGEVSLTLCYEQFDVLNEKIILKLVQFVETSSGPVWRRVWPAGRTRRQTAVGPRSRFGPCRIRLYVRGSDVVKTCFRDRAVIGTHISY
jgi:hypothetical protein